MNAVFAFARGALFGWFLAGPRRDPCLESQLDFERGMRALVRCIASSAIAADDLAEALRGWEAAEESGRA